MIYTKHELTSEAGKKLDLALSSRRIERRELVYFFAPFIQAWICSARPESIYPRCIRDFRMWQSDVIGPEPNLPGVYYRGGDESSEEGPALIFDGKVRSSAISKWLKSVPGSVIQTWRQPIIPPRKTKGMKQVLSYYENHPKELLDRYAYIAGDAKRINKTLSASGYSLNALFDYIQDDIYEVIFNELPIEIISNVASYCARTRGNARITNEMGKFKAGVYHNPISKEDVVYKGGRKPKVLSNWVQTHGEDLVKQWKQ